MPRARPLRCRRLAAPLLWGLLLLTPAARAEGEIAIFASRNWAAAREVTLPTLRRVYLGRVTRLLGRRVERFHLRSGSPTREAFCLAVLGRSGMALEDYWVEQALRGGPAPPREISRLDVLVRKVSETPGAIAYARLTDLEGLDTSGVRIIALRSDGRSLLPGDPDYPIREAPAPPREPRASGR